MRTLAVPRRRRVSLGRCLVAGVVAGVVAAALGLGLGAVIGAHLPPPRLVAGTAFTAGILAGILYWVLSRGSRRPLVWLWVISLALAAADSLLIAHEPLAAVRGPASLSFMLGLLAPFMQVLGLLGAVKLGHGHFPAAALGFDASLHFLTAVAACATISAWMRGRTA